MVIKIKDYLLYIVKYPYHEALKALLLSHSELASWSLEVCSYWILSSALWVPLGTLPNPPLPNYPQ